MALPIVASPELAALREELGILHEVFAALAAGNIRASEWQKAQLILNYLDRKIAAVQAQADALTPNVPAESDGPVIPTKLAAVPEAAAPQEA